jgi:predicted Zn-dependent peptidase
MAPMPQVKSATVMVLVEAGSRYESRKNNGVSHFLEHMVFKGTKRRPSKLHIARELDGVGASYNAFTGKETTGYYVKLAAENLSLAVDVVADMLLNSLYDQAEIEKEKGVILQEVNLEEDEPPTRAAMLFEELVFAGSPLGMRIAGEKETLATISREDIASYVQSMYHSGSIVIGVAGQTGDGQGLIEKHFAGVVKGPENTYEPFLPAQTKAQARIIYKKTDQAHLNLGVRGVSLKDPDRYPLALLAVILGGPMSSRLFIEVRDKRGLAYYVASGSEEYRDTGFFVTQAGVGVDKVGETVRLILEQMKTVSDRGVTEEELKRAKDYLRGKTVLSMEDSARVAMFFTSQEILEKKVETIEEVLVKVDAVTSEDIKRAAQKHFTTDSLNLAMVGPFKESERFVKLLKL